jgi:hypothetical protein
MLARVELPVEVQTIQVDGARSETVSCFVGDQ